MRGVRPNGSHPDRKRSEAGNHLKAKEESVGPQWAWYALVLACVYRMTAADLAVVVQHGFRVASQTRVEYHSAVRVTTITAADEPPDGPPGIARRQHPPVRLQKGRRRG